MPYVRGAGRQAGQQAGFAPPERRSSPLSDAHPMSAAKIVVVGAVGVGKTAVVRRFACDRFSQDYVTTVGVHVVARDLTIFGDANGSAGRLRFVVWDTDGDLGHAIFGTTYMAGAAAAIGVADATRPDTLDVMWSLLEAFEGRGRRRPTCALVTKWDLVTGGEVAGSCALDPRIRPVSAATGEGVRQAFLDLAARIGARGGAG